MRKTVTKDFSVEGSGIHTGVFSVLDVRPSYSGQGIYFSYDDPDLSGAGFIPCHVANVVSTSRCTVLGNGKKTVSTVEHILATLNANGITDAELHIDGGEIPILDGSGLAFQRLIDKVGLSEYEGDDWSVLIIEEPMEFFCTKSNAHYLMTPHEGYELEVILKYDNRLLGDMSANWSFGDDYGCEIAPARTFSLYSEISGLLKSGMIQGGNLKNAIVILDDDLSPSEVKVEIEKYISDVSDVSLENNVVNGPMLFDNEPARHKLLDMLGDLSLLNLRIRGKISATRPGHTGNYNLARYLINEFYG